MRSKHPLLEAIAALLTFPAAVFIALGAWPIIAALAAVGTLGAGGIWWVSR